MQVFLSYHGTVFSRLLKMIPGQQAQWRQTLIYPHKTMIENKGITAIPG